MTLQFNSAALMPRREHAGAARCPQGAAAAVRRQRHRRGTAGFSEVA